MQEKIRYINHLNESIDFGENGIYIAASDIHDYDWNVNSANNKISSFSKSITNRNLPVTIFCKTAEEGIEVRNRLVELAEKDVLMNKPGRLVIGDYYYKCYITASKKSDYLKTKRLMITELTITTDYPFWILEKKKSFFPSQKPTNTGNLDFPFDFAFDFANAEKGASAWTIDHFTDNHFRMTIYGPCENPKILINHYPREVVTSLDSNEYLVIDSKNHTVMKYSSNGNSENLYNNRQKQQSIFEKIPSGQLSLNWNGDFGFDLLLFIERSEPKWI